MSIVPVLSRDSFYLRCFVILVSAMLAGLDNAAAAAAKDEAEWTVMFYMDGENDLEKHALGDVRELLSVGSTEKVNVLVQLDRGRWFASADSTEYGDWTGTLRFRLADGKEPLPAHAADDPGDQNMGSPDALRNFVVWCQEQCPAKRYMLVIWDHGSGTHTMRPPALLQSVELALDGLKAKEAKIRSRLKLSVFLAGSLPQADLQAHVYNDSLHLAEMVQALSNLPSGRKLDVIKLDACRMAMLETAYGLQVVADVMVASEEEMNAGTWSQASWLKPLVDQPSMDSRTLGKLLVEKYAASYPHPMPDIEWTVSATSLEKIGETAKLTSTLAEALLADLKANQRTGIDDARKLVTPYGMRLSGVDLDFFCEKVIEQHSAGKLGLATKDAALALRAQLVGTVICSEASDNRKKDYGSRGLSIFFPAKLDEFKNSAEKKWYFETNTDNPLRFVLDHEWDNFIRTLLAVP